VDIRVILIWNMDLVDLELIYLFTYL